MISTRRYLSNIAIIIVLLLYLQTTSLGAGLHRRTFCPIGFEVAYSNGDPICFQKKGPETFADRFKDCAGNRFTLKLLRSLNITLADHPIWTDYKNMYDGGPFIDWSYTEDAGDLLAATYDVRIDTMYNYKDELCVTMDPVFNFTAVRCNEMHYRYCIVDVYEIPDAPIDRDRHDGCESFNNPLINPSSDSDLDDDLLADEEIERSTFRFYSPMSTCMLKVPNKVRMTWQQSLQTCKSKGGSLLNRGWRYSNYPIFNKILSGRRFPFGVILSSNLTLLRYEAEHDSALIPQSEWHIGTKIILDDTRLGAILGDSWDFVNNTYIFYNVLCEKTIPLRQVNLTVFIYDDSIYLSVNDTDLDKKDIHCYTDSSNIYPKSVRITSDISRDIPAKYLLKIVKNGYYWCTHSDSKKFYISESNKVLYIKVKEDVFNLYAVQLTSLARDYNFTNMGKYMKDWKKKIEEYVFYSTKYSISHGSSDVDNRTIWKFRNDSPGMDVKNADVALKRVYLNSRTALLHVDLHPKMMPVKPGQWDDISVDYMLPVYYCELKDSLTKRLELGEVYRVSACKIYTCTGNFNEGVKLIITAEKTCSTPVPVNVTSSITVADYYTTTPVHQYTAFVTTRDTRHQYRQASSDSSQEEKSTSPEPSTTTESPTVITTTELTESPLSYWPPTQSPKPPTLSTFPTPVITAEPTFPTTPEVTTTSRPIPPAEQLEQVIASLDSLINNNTHPVMMADIRDTFDEMDKFLADTEDLEIPGDLLHLLDELGGRIDLNGSNDAAAVSENVALVVADARPASPVRGLKIATRSMDQFDGSAFEIIRDDINSTHLMADTNEVVVQLPDSIADSYLRISFVAFRNDRAFQSSHGLYAVNSRVLSINVQNTTHFHDGEVIQIYLTPQNDDPDRNQSRTCAFWKFLDDGSGAGYWSQDGCVFNRATVEGMLDSCQCDHLTHFAEVLIPRTVFSEKNENALEIISIIGCSLSIFGLIWVGITALLFRSWRRDYSNKIWMQLCISIFILSLSFMIIIFAHFEEYDVLCMLTGIILHFSVLSSFCWMLVAAVLSYRRLVTVFTIDASHKLLRASAFAWGAPCAIVGILLSVAPHSYSGRFDEKTPTAAFCYPSGLALWLSVYAPLAVMLLANWTLFVLIVRSVLASRRNHPTRQLGNRHSGERNEALRCASVSFFLVFLFGLPWLFGLFSMNVVMAYIFVIFSTFQGFILFLFFVFGNQKTRDLWLNKLKIKQTRKIPVTSSTYTNNRSTGGNVHSRSGNGETIEAKVSRPKSLTSSDNSRFS